MANNNSRWGCCIPENEDDESFILCLKCNKKYHFACMSLDDKLFNSEMKAVWSCPDCVRSIPRSNKNDNTPIRNISTTRGSKRQALNSPPMDPEHSLIIRDSVREAVDEAIKENMKEMFSKIHDNIRAAIVKEFKPIKEELSQLKDSMNFINSSYEEFKRDIESYKSKVLALENQNIRLINAVDDLQSRINQSEQQLRQNNVELQCVPERNNEDLVKIVNNLCTTIQSNINEKDILHCTRTAKANRASNRPRSIIIQLSSAKVRDELLASTSKYNKSNPQNKLNSTHLGISGASSPVYVSEHLSPANKAIHAATRIKAKDKGYKFVWIRNGRIYLRKNEGSELIFVKSLDILNKIN
ncbi:unnamed protein product [Colias eurytheme]|nr:unnamed protein product [Colias eurytheme]